MYPGGTQQGRHAQRFEQAQLQHEHFRDLFAKVHEEERGLAADKAKALIEKLHEGRLEKAQLDHRHARDLFEKLHGHETGRDDADKTKTKRGILENLLEKAAVDHGKVREAIERLHHHEAELDDKVEMQRSLFDRLHKDLLDKSQLDHDHVRTLFEALHGEKRGLSAADRTRIMADITRQLDAAREGKEQKRVGVEDAKDEVREPRR